MSKPYMFLCAIGRHEAINWSRFVRTMSQHHICPQVIYTVFSPQSNYAPLTHVQINDEEIYRYLLEQFPKPIAATNRITAALAGNSHRTAVEGGVIVLQENHQENFFVAISRNGTTWTPLPNTHQHLVIVENMQNFLHSEATFRFLYRDCHFTPPPHSTLLAYGAGNAAAKACHAIYYQYFSSVNCLFDIDPGGLEIYISIKKLLSPYGIYPIFLAPYDLTERLKKSRWFLNEQERRVLFLLSQHHPELQPIIAQMLKTQKKLEQEVYLED